jgi:hypothetical protein
VKATFDAVAEGNKENYKPAIDLMYDVYLKQHKPMLDEICNKIVKGGLRAFSEIDELVTQFSDIKDFKTKHRFRRRGIASTVLATDVCTSSIKFRAIRKLLGTGS